MFQFTTTTVINSDKDKTTGKPLWTTEGSDATAVLRVKRVANFKQPNVKAIYKTTAVEPSTAKVKMNFGSVDAMEGDSMRLDIYVGLSEASQNSRYSNDFYSKGKPFSVEFQWLGDVETTVNKLVENIKKYQVMVFGEKLLNVYASDTNYLNIEAVDEYQRFKKVNIDKFFNKTDKTPDVAMMGEYRTLYSLNAAAFAKPKKTKEELNGENEGIFLGNEGFGTYSFLLHNLRIPTFENTRPFGVGQVEAPIVGAKYNEYVIHYSVDRGILGSNAVGDTVTSNTTHVFYVLDSLCSTFETALKTVGALTDVKTKDEAALEP